MAFLRVSFLVLTTLLYHLGAGADDELVLDQNEFFIYNRQYHKARLAMWGEGDRDFGTNEHAIEDNQLWFLEAHPYEEGCYYIKNEVYSQNRLAAHSTKNLLSYNGPHYEDQLWKFVPSGKDDGFYYIYNCLHKEHRITKLGVEDYRVYVTKGARADNQLWKLIPRFEAQIYTDDVFHFDNRQGSQPIKRTISYTKGLKRTSTSSVRNKMTYKTSMTASYGGASASAEFSAELEMSLSQSSEQSWSKTETMTFTIPAHKNVKVMQHKVNFVGEIPTDSCTLMTDVKLFESDSATFSDNDGFIISS